MLLCLTRFLLWGCHSPLSLLVGAVSTARAYNMFDGMPLRGKTPQNRISPRGKTFAASSFFAPLPE
jgi:hypothetical protein